MGAFRVNLLVVPGLAALTLLLASRMIWLASRRLGWLNYLANVAFEFGVKRVRVSRRAAETLLACGSFVFLLAGGIGTTGVVAAGLGLALIELLVRRKERYLLCTAYTRMDGIGPRPRSNAATMGLAQGYPAPSVHPELTVTAIGPFTARWPQLSLGTLVVGRRFRIDVVVGNHTRVPTLTRVRVKVQVPSVLRLEGDAEKILAPIQPGETRQVSIACVAIAECGRGELQVVVEWGDRRMRLSVTVDGGILPSRARIGGGTIRRYPGARRSAFAWRGDMDVYDWSTLQSVAGLEVTLGLASRYCIPQTMYLSTRLTLDQAAARKWAEHYGITRGAEEIPTFVSWMRNHVQLIHQGEYPLVSEKQYALEVGNHGHIHFGDDSAAAEENGWREGARMGCGAYPWLGEDRSSFGEQRDNALEARRWMERLFGFTPKSWAMPDRTRDEHTPQAMEAAGCEVLSDSDARTIDNVLFQPAPHFPAGTNAVELTKRYPGDPQHIFHYAMNLFWIHRAHRRGIPVIFMCHQHMRQFDGQACARFTEAILRHVLEAFNGDLWVSTVYGVGVYWRDVLSERRTVCAELIDGVVKVKNESSFRYEGVPVDLRFEGGGRATILVDLDPGQEAVVDALGPR